MEWTEETISHLRALWQEGHSTAEIGRQLAITKNAVVGKAHRLGLPPRPSPIRRQPNPVVAAAPDAPAPAKATPAEVAAHAAPAVAEPVVVAPQKIEAKAPPLPRKIEVPVVEASAAPPVVAVKPAVVAAPPQVAPAPIAAEVAPKPVAAPAPEPVVRAPRPALRAVSATPAPRRSGLTCCWPLGEPGTKGFHFCGGSPLPGKPYCAEHAQLAYVKLRDRRDNVA